MRRMTKTLFLLGALASMTVASAPMSTFANERAARVNASLRARFHESGRIGRIDASTQTLIVGDGTLKLSPWVRVYAGSGEISGVAALHKGTRIAFNMNWPDPKVTPVVTEILILSEPGS